MAITQVLGRIEAPGVEALTGNGAANNTRWVFDIEGEGGKDIALYLLEHRSGRRLTPDLMSYSLTALSPSFYDARPVARYDDKTGCFTVSSLRFEGERGHFACRVAIDVMHSATR